MKRQMWNTSYNTLGKERKRGDGSLYSSYRTCRQNGNISLLLLTHLIVAKQTKDDLSWVKRVLDKKKKKKKVRKVKCHLILFIKHLEAASVLAFVLVLYNTLNGIVLQNQVWVIEKKKKKSFDPLWNILDIVSFTYKSPYTDYLQGALCSSYGV